MRRRPPLTFVSTPERCLVTFIEYVMFMFAGMVVGAILGRLFMSWYWNKGGKKDLLDRVLARLRGA